MTRRQPAGCRVLTFNGTRKQQEITMFRGLALWMLGVPIGGIIILSLLGFLN